MMTKDQIHQLQESFQRIFAMPVTRSTYRELQNALMHFTSRNEELSNKILQSLFGSKEEHKIASSEAKESFQGFVQRYGVLTRLAKDVFEKGEFINLVTSDMIGQNNLLAFLNRFRRIDGEEMQFLTDTDGTIHLLEHFVNRLNELKKNEKGRQLLSSKKAQFESLKKQIDALLQ